MKRRSSMQISLVLVGTLALATGCEKEQRNVYKSKEDCAQDWGREDACEEVGTTNRHYGGGYYPLGYFYGPRYTPSSRPQGIYPMRSVGVARGGFGGLSGFHGGGRG
jgi:uncharacterized protein YgiB involved in biofilm formation